MKQVVIIGLVVVALLAIYLIVKRSVPHVESMHTRQITFDSITTTGPVVFIVDKSSSKKFWLKSYTSFDVSEFDSLKGKSAKIHYMKVLAGPFENRIFQIEIDSVLIFDQAVEDN